MVYRQMMHALHSVAQQAGLQPSASLATYKPTPAVAPQFEELLARIREAAAKSASQRDAASAANRDAGAKSGAQAGHVSAKVKHARQPNSATIGSNRTGTQCADDAYPDITKTASGHADSRTPANDPGAAAAKPQSTEAASAAVIVPQPLEPSPSSQGTVANGLARGEVRKITCTRNTQPATTGLPAEKVPDGGDASPSSAEHAPGVLAGAFGISPPHSDLPLLPPLQTFVAHGVAPFADAISSHQKSSAPASSQSGTEQAGTYATQDYSGQHMLLATSNVLEVGITGGAHGWLRVRAEMGHTGEVTASLVASNASSASALHKEVGAISDYLKTTAVGVTSLVVTAPERSMGAPGAATYPFAGGGAGTSAEGGRSGQPSSESAAEAPSTRPGSPACAVPAERSAGARSLVGGTSGGWLNVMA